MGKWGDSNLSPFGDFRLLTIDFQRLAMGISWGKDGEMGIALGRFRPRLLLFNRVARMAGLFKWVGVGGVALPYHPFDLIPPSCHVTTSQSRVGLNSNA